MRGFFYNNVLTIVIQNVTAKSSKNERRQINEKFQKGVYCIKRTRDMTRIIQYIQVNKKFHKL